MKKTPSLIAFIFYAIYLIVSYLTGETWLSLLIFLIPFGFLLTNLLLRKSLSYKNWFLSPLNIFLEIKTQQFQNEIMSDLLFEKLIEVIKNSQFKLLDTNKDSLNILCGTSPNFWTWGENIYVQLEKSTNGSIVTFTSVTMFGKSWNRNQKNFESFIESLETSLTI